MAENKKYKVDFDEINELADSYFRAPDMTKRSKIMELFFNNILQEDMRQAAEDLCQEKRSRKSDLNLEDRVNFFGVDAPKNVIIDTFEEAFGEKTLKNGTKSKRGFKPEKGMKFTTYFLGLLKNNVKNYLEKQTPSTSISINDNGEYIFPKKSGITKDLWDSSDETEETDSKDKKIDKKVKKYENPYGGEGVYTENGYGTNVSDMVIVNTAKFCSEILKTGKADSMTRGIYSLILVNYSRVYDDTFVDLNECTDLLFEPVEHGYIDKMTTFYHPKDEQSKAENFLALNKAELSKYVEQNNLSKRLSKSSVVKVLIDKSVEVYYNRKNEMSNQKKALMKQLQEVIYR